jgi:hypothetical protein
LCTTFVKGVFSRLALWLANDAYWALTESTFNFTWFETAARFTIALGPYFTVIAWGTIRINTNTWFCCNSFGANNRWCRLGVICRFFVIRCGNIFWHTLTDWTAAVIINNYATMTRWTGCFSEFGALGLIAFTIVGTAALVDFLNLGILVVLAFFWFKVADYASALEWSAISDCTAWI